MNPKPPRVPLGTIMPSSEAHHHTAQMVGVGARELKIVTQGASRGGFKVLNWALFGKLGASEIENAINQGSM